MTEKELINKIVEESSVDRNDVDEVIEALRAIDPSELVECEDDEVTRQHITQWKKL